MLQNEDVNTYSPGVCCKDCSWEKNESSFPWQAFKMTEQTDARRLFWEYEEGA